MAKYHCEECNRTITTKEEIEIGYCNSCRTYCNNCGEETTGDIMYNGLCSDCEDERLEDLKDEEGYEE